MQDKPTQKTPEAEIHKKKIISIWWDYKGIINEFCTLNFYQETKRLIQTCTFNSFPNQEKRPEL